jgi:hypothetical protein
MESHILMVAGPPKQGHLRHMDRGGVAILWKTSANWEVKQEIVSDHASHQSVHQCATWTIQSKRFLYPIHITGVYTSPNGTGTEDFYHTLEQQNKFPPPTHMFTPATLMPTSRKNLRKHSRRYQSEQYPHEKGTCPGMTRPTCATPRPPPTWAQSRTTQPRRIEVDYY